MDFLKLPDAPRFTLANASVPACLIGAPGDLVRLNLTIERDSIVPHDGQPGETIDLNGAMLLPTFTDMHTHLDKGHIWPRAPNPDGTFMGALNTAGADRTARWSAADLRARMEFSLKSAYAHGTSAIRTHLDAIAPEVLQHLEVMQEGGQTMFAGLSLVKFTTEARLDEIVKIHEDLGCMIFNPHRYTLEEGGRQSVDDRQLAFKREADPKGLLNPGKMIAWDDPAFDYAQVYAYAKMQIAL